MTDSFDASLFCLPASAPLRDALALMRRNERGIALAVDGEERLVRVVTDGDIRRAILEELDLGTPIRDLERRLDPPGRAELVVGRAGDSEAGHRTLMTQAGVEQLPVVDAAGHVADLVFAQDSLNPESLPLRAVVMAGGAGKRLRPLTESMPKPMLPLGDRPVMEHLIGQLRSSGIRKIAVSTHFMPEKIRDYFGDGTSFGVEIRYVHEDAPLGTAGVLSLLETIDEPTLLVNGDLLTRVDFAAMLRFHRTHGANLTVGVRQFDLEVPYGVIDRDGPFIRKVREKPKYHFLVNAGIYMLDAEAQRRVPSGRRYDMTDLMEALIAEGCRVVSFPIMEYWLDIGHPNDYEKAQSDVEEGRVDS
jgi:dTDP-glucose pyrophosphorylase/CBS domain-containing protein